MNEVSALKAITMNYWLFSSCQQFNKVWNHCSIGSIRTLPWTVDIEELQASPLRRRRATVGDDTGNAPIKKVLTPPVRIQRF